MKQLILSLILPFPALKSLFCSATAALTLLFSVIESVKIAPNFSYLPAAFLPRFAGLLLLLKPSKPDAGNLFNLTCVVARSDRNESSMGIKRRRKGHKAEGV